MGRAQKAGDDSSYLFHYRSMQPGRVPIWNMVAELEPSAWLEAVALSSDNRLLLPQALRKRLSWGAPKTNRALLAAIGPKGQVNLQPLSERQTEIDALRAVLSDASPGARGALTLAAMALYCQVSLQPDGRLRLPPALARHLREPAESLIWVGAYGDDLMLWSEIAWAKIVRQQSAVLREALRKASATGPLADRQD